MLVLLFGLYPSNNSFAVIDAGDQSGTITDLQTTMSPISSGTTTPPTASLTLSNANMTSSPATPGSIATVSTNITVSVDNAESYSLTLSVDSTNIKSGNTTLTAGNVINDNTWGYKWDNASSYSMPSTSGTNLTVPAVDSNGTASFTKNLTFGAKFGSNAEAGTYHGSGTVSLVATPRTAAITLANLTQMQQLSLPEAAGACNNTPYLSGQNYSAEYTLTDIRDGNKYTIRKFQMDNDGSGKCWMTQNLALRDRHANSMTSYTGGRILNSTTSDITTSTWTLPYASVSGFSNDTASNMYVNTDANGILTSYYSWCAATAGTCSSATSQGAHASSSICPKGWRLPGGYNDATYSNEFRALFFNMGLTISNSSLANTSNSSTSWGSGDLAKVQGSPYKFAYTGLVTNGSFSTPSSNQYGCWWSSTASGSSRAYYLTINSNRVYPGTDDNARYVGFAVRCVSQ